VDRSSEEVEQNRVKVQSRGLYGIPGNRRSLKHDQLRSITPPPVQIGHFPTRCSSGDQSLVFGEKKEIGDGGGNGSIAA